MKEEITSFDVAAVVYELNKTILDARINNVYQTDSKTLLFKLHKPDKPAFHLLVEAGKRLHLTSYAVEKPKVPPMFCMALRKHLRNGRVVGIEQHGFERVVVFKVRTKAGEFRLVCELFGDGNLILVDDANRILQALSYKRMRDRNILRGEVFRFAPSIGRNPLEVSREDMDELRGFGNVEVVRGLARFLSVGGVYAEEFLLGAGVDKTMPCSKLEDSAIDAISKGVRDVIERVVNGRFEPCVVFDEGGGVVDVVPFRLRRYNGLKHEAYGSFNEALDEFYARVAVSEKALTGVEAEELKREAGRLRRVVAEQEKALVDAEGKADREKRIGGVIYLHSGELQTLMDRFLEGKKSGKDWRLIVSEVEAEKKANLKPALFFDSFDARGLVLGVCVEGLCFPLDLRLGLFVNAARFYEHAKKAKRKLEGVKAALDETRKKLEGVEAKARTEAVERKAEAVEAEKRLVRREVKPREWFERFRWFFSSDGFLVVAGKDAVSNEVLIKKHTEAKDVVLHADVVGAPFVVVKAEGKKSSEQTLREAAEFAAAFSRGWREGFTSTDVFWVKPEQLSKGAPSGEFVGRGAFVVRGKRDWLRGVPLRLAVGVVVEENGEFRFVGGPVDAVKTKADTYVVVVPGDQSGKELFRRVLGVLAGKMPKELREKVLKASVEEVREFIPYSKGRILES